MTELQKCLNGTSTYCHGDKVKAIYTVLNALGNNESWQLCVLDILKTGIEQKIEDDYQTMRTIEKSATKKNSREWCDQRGF